MSNAAAASTPRSAGKQRRRSSVAGTPKANGDAGNAKAGAPAGAAAATPTAQGKTKEPGSGKKPQHAAGKKQDGSTPLSKGKGSGKADGKTPSRAASKRAAAGTEEDADADSRPANAADWRPDTLLPYSVIASGAASSQPPLFSEDGQ